MRKTSFTGKKRFETSEVPTPQPGAGEVLVRNMVCGVCGTDVHIYHGSPGSAEVNPPVVLGHEYAGVVEALGPGVEGFAVGDRVTVDPNIYCGTCRHCQNGKKQMCENMQAVGVTMDGGFADYSVVPAAQLFLLGPGVDFEAGAMAEPLACCLHGIDLAGIRPGDDVLVIGGGAIGQMMLQLARLAGAARVVLSEPVEARRTLALELAADYAIDPLAGDAAAQWQQLLGTEGADVVIECVGKPATTAQAVACAGKGATVLLFGVPDIDAVGEIPLNPIFKKELTIRGSFVNPDTHARAVALLNSGRVDVAPLITHRFPLEALEDAIQTQMGAESVKVVVRTDL